MKQQMTFQALNRCECCRKRITENMRFIAVVKFPDGGCDTVCVACYHEMTRAAIAWFAYEGDLSQMSTERRQSVARDVANREKALTALEGLVEQKESAFHRQSS